MTATFDYVIIGGGTAGLVVAARLTEDESVRVCVLEAGEDVTHTDEASIPGMAPKLWEQSTNWGFSSTPQKHSDNAVLQVPRGKGLGGSSMANLMQLIRAPAKEYDAFEKLGLKGWNSSEFLKYFIKSQSLSYTPESTRKLGLKPDEKQFGNGPIVNTLPRYKSSYDNKWIEALEENGISYNRNAMGGETIGSWFTNLSIHPETAKRISSATAYYEPNKHRKNLTVIVGAHVSRIQLNTSSPGNPVAEGVEYQTNGEKHLVFAAKEVVLAAGAIQTPQILELSGNTIQVRLLAALLNDAMKGIGRKAILDQYGIATVVDLPGVGENLLSSHSFKDHLGIIAVYELEPPHESFDVMQSDPSRAVAEYQKFVEKQEGMLSSIPTLYGFIPLSKLDGGESLRDHAIKQEWGKIQDAVVKIQQEWLSDDTVPQIEFAAIPFFWPSIVKPQRDEGKSYLSASPVLLHPFSRGSVHITSTDPFTHPSIDLSALDNEFDFQVLLKGLKLIRKVFTETKAFGDVIAKEVAPGSMGDTDEGLEKYMRSGLMTIFHPMGTAAMMKREDRGVVDERMRVYGVDRLRIVDASILPFQVGAHLQATVYALAEKASDNSTSFSLLVDMKLHHTGC
ncbi:hypothetical protein NP233_g2760 [Leucocoprinus birnbaumii]|uniref:pyranose dehydrogenase (acceptor) n=1 Tax=Leucocoprinus birnbaumii TaxID=56174 RepID=A0AAD5W419_9AGAR|nr:hypothetical protein NP233_g2760 [Leucocoprinus birnbaumii]